MKPSTRFIVAACLVALFIAGCASQGPYLRLDPSLQKDVRVFEGTQYIPLIPLCDAYGLRWDWDPFMNTAAIERKGKIVLRAGSDVILVNGVEKRLDRPVLVTGSVVYVPLSLVRNGLNAIVETAPRYASQGQTYAPAQVAAPSGKYTIETIVLDAGHGGKDPGAISRRFRIKEKDQALYVARQLKKALEARGIRVIMTRSDDTFISLPGRVDIANRSDADLFVSIHLNSSRSRSLTGFECYYLSEATDDNSRALEAFENASLKLEEGTAVGENSKGLGTTLWDMKLTENRHESMELASHICRAVDRSFLTRNRGTKTARFYVLKGTRMPSVLVEVGYLSNRLEELKLKDQKYLDKAVDALVRGIEAYKSEYERTEGFTL
ncbi:MAG: N-acetylmuramoyl-L-alanine amidase [Candidatus Omnitrophica bacterium]|nr:N-acetylmuramoyl-L-alanine amidase [Candidatus Omnitrophota bacterium]